jgi:hypothetical protein
MIASGGFEAVGAVTCLWFPGPSKSGKFQFGGMGLERHFRQEDAEVQLRRRSPSSCKPWLDSAGSYVLITFASPGTQSMSLQPLEKTDPEVSEQEIDEVLAEFDGDARAALRALLHDQAELIRDAQQAVSRGFIRGVFAAGARRPDAEDEV